MADLSHARLHNDCNCAAPLGGMIKYRLGDSISSAKRASEHRPGNFCSCFASAI
jgi:hypothetical protein